MNKKSQYLIALVVIVLATVSGVLFSKWLNQKQGLPQDMEAIVLPQSRPVAHFTMVDHNGKHFGMEQLKDKWTFMFFGYTHCPDVCPSTLAVMNSVAQSIEEEDGSLDNVQFVFVSVDPDRDSPQQLKEYLAYFNQSFIGITGERQQIDALTRQMSVMYFLNNKKDKKDYSVDHSAAILLTEPSGGLRSLFSTPHIPESIFKSFKIIRKHYS
ncbi:MAG: SCO family protein [Gammaproteobacteria bacterium]|nr:SCO family protein [Gammaproteobacteria bacterium]